MKISYNAWRDSVSRILVGQGHVKHERKIAPDIYMPYYEDGYSPAKAVREDLGINAIHFYDVRSPFCENNPDKEGQQDETI